MPQPCAYLTERNNGLVLFSSSDGEVSLPVSVDYSGNEIWLTRNQMAELYSRDVKTIGKHVNNALSEELQGSEDRVVAKIATTAADGKTYNTEHYGLDIVLSVGYRVKSQRGVEFRRWATGVLRQHIVEGHTENQKRLERRRQETPSRCNACGAYHHDCRVASR